MPTLTLAYLMILVQSVSLGLFISLSVLGIRHYVLTVAKDEDLDDPAIF